MEGLNEEQEKQIDMYINKFEEEFEIKVKNKINKKLLITLFHEYIEENSKPSKEYYFILNKISEMEKQLSEILNAKQKVMLAELNFLQQRLEDELIMQRIYLWFLYAVIP